MKGTRSLLVVTLLLAAGMCSMGFAQSPARSMSRITESIDESQTVPLASSIHPLTRPGKRSRFVKRRSIDGTHDSSSEAE